MKRRLSTTGVFLLALALVLVGLGACTKSAEERETAPGTTPVASPVSGGQVSSPAPGETVVSAVTSVPQTPGAGIQPTLESVSGTPASGQTAPTAVSVATTAPVATAVPTTGQPAPSGQTGTIVHTVQRGETLSSIARRYGTTTQAIVQANNLVNPNQIYVGQKLKIPTSGETSGGTSGGTAGCRIRHTVKRGEWVWQIARNYGVSPYDILAANGLTIQTANTIYPGTVLCIP